MAGVSKAGVSKAGVSKAGVSKAGVSKAGVSKAGARSGCAVLRCGWPPPGAAHRLAAKIVIAVSDPARISTSLAARAADNTSEPVARTAAPAWRSRSSYSVALPILRADVSRVRR
jgi:hypothetical protein